MKLISVIIPVYNSDKYIAQCLDSILNNTYKDIELICIDDGSKDQSAEIISQYQAAHPNIILIRQENAGVSAARNTGLKAAKGEYISFVDSDDEIASVFFESLLNAIESTGSDLSACSYSTDQLNAGPFTHEYKVYEDGEYYRIKQLKNYIWPKLFKKETIEGIQFAQQLTFAEDMAFNAEILTDFLNKKRSIRCAFTNDKIYYYRQVNSSLSHSSDVERWMPLCAWLGEYAEQETNPIIKSLTRYEALKKWLTVFYESKTSSKKRITYEARNSLKKLSREVTYIPGYMSSKQYMSLLMFAHIPNLYVLFRRITKR